MSNIGNVTLLSPSSTSSSTGSTSTVSSNSSQTLTQQDFLKIMVAQFTQQDPLSSSDGSGGGDSGTSSYVSQLMAMTNLTTEQTMSSQQLEQLANALPGATVEVNNNGTNVTGVVQKTAVDANGGLDLIINGKSYLSSTLVSIDQTQAQAAVAAAASATATTPATTTATGN
jgi:flagellar hook assembly protein FlgD